MKRRRFLYTLGGVASSSICGGSTSGFPGIAARDAADGIVAMYVHAAWPYNRPYAARSWTVDDWRGYAEGISKLGYNTLVFWPDLETMPSPLTASDRAQIERIAKVIEILHHEFEVRFWMTLTPNLVVKNEEAAKYRFDQRPFYRCFGIADPGDPAAMSKMIKRREELFRPLSQMDALIIIDSDAGGYPGSNNREFVQLLAEHRRMLDRLRPGIAIYYWMHFGWQAFCRFYQTGEHPRATAEETRDVLTQLKELNPEPWGITNSAEKPIFSPPDRTAFDIATKLGLASRAVAFTYGAIEQEPTFPMTNFGGEKAFQVGSAKLPRGVIGNAQTHCVQLPNTFAFVRGAKGEARPTEADYVQFADDLIMGRGHLIVQGWQALAGTDPRWMRAMADQLEAVCQGKLVPGRLQGLLFGDARRFLTDLAMELRLKAAYDEFVASSENGRGMKGPLQQFVAAADAWQKQTGYQDKWSWPSLRETLQKLKSPAIDAVLDEVRTSLQGEGNTPFDRVDDYFRKTETFTPRLIAAMKKAQASL